MQNTIRWSLFGETINEQLNLEQLPKYITGDFKKDTEKYINLKKEDIFYAFYKNKQIYIIKRNELKD